MGCAGCGGAKSPRCNLCGLSSKNFYPWGTKRKICWRCHDKMIKKIEDYTKEIDRVKTLLKGKEWSRNG